MLKLNAFQVIYFSDYVKIIYVLNKINLLLKYIKYNHMTNGTFLSHKTPAFFFKQALSKYGKVKNEKEVFHKIYIFQT